ncbi:cytochrome P450 family protein sad [Oratosquilla oratoria]|uniref:cytochrome P450 family protein sad n=1 Tax=Oratosquilla oratoria TaxID=337810 RepID=UPI003F762904
MLISRAMALPSAVVIFWWHFRHTARNLMAAQAHRHAVRLASTPREAEVDVASVVKDDPSAGQGGTTSEYQKERCYPRPYQEIPSPYHRPLLGTIPDLLAMGGTAHLHEYIAARHRELGAIFRERLGGGPELIFAAEATTVQQVYSSEGRYPSHFVPEAWTLYNKDHGASRGLFFMDGDEWLENRRILNRRLLRPSGLSPHLEGIQAVTDDLIQSWTDNSEDCCILDLERQMYKWSIESLGVFLFGGRLGLLKEGGGQEDVWMEEFMDAVHGIFKETTSMGVVPPTLARALKLPTWRRFVASVDKGLKQGRQLVQWGISASHQRHLRGDPPQSILDLLLYRDNMEEETLHRIIIDLFLAAADTTSHTVIWALYLLGTNRNVAERARQEVWKVLEISGVPDPGDYRNIKGHHLASLPYLKAVVKEVMRLYPVAPFLTRALPRDTVLNGYAVPAGTMVILSVFSTGRDPRYFPNPSDFRPERWLRGSSSSNSKYRKSSAARRTEDSAKSESSPVDSSAADVETSSSLTKNENTNQSSNYSLANTDGDEPWEEVVELQGGRESPKRPKTQCTRDQKIHSHAFIPFGKGARSCIGKRVAENEMHLLLAKVLLQFDLEVLNKVTMVMRMVGVTSEPLKLKVTPRT